MRRTCLQAFVILSGIVLGGGAAAQAISHPFTGVTLSRSGSTALTVVDLCAPGVSMRATRYVERQGTPQQWATRGDVNAQVAINADFFDLPGWSWVIGRAMGAGEAWPAGAQNREARSFWQFGANVSEFDENSAAPIHPETTEMVGGHNVLIRNGASLAPNFDGDSVITTLHNRTAIGISQDRRFVYLYAAGVAQNGTQLVASMTALAAAAGAPAIYFATNQDGGGSSQMYVAGLGQIVTSGRQVNNHLGVLARGSGPATNCPNHPPRGYLDSASCSAVVGWAQDVDAADAAIPVHLYVDAVPGTPGVNVFVTSAGVSRDDLCTAIGSCAHGFSAPLPLSLQDGRSHAIHAYGIDSAGGANPELAASPRSFSCTAKPAGVLRHVTDPASFAAWGFVPFTDQVNLPDSALAGLAAGEDFPAAPLLYNREGAAEVDVLDQGRRRHVTNPAVAAAWHLDLGKVQRMAAADWDALPVGPPLRGAPYLVKGGGPAVSVVDDPFPVVVPPQPDPDPDAGTVTPVDAGKVAGPTETRVTPLTPVGSGCSALPGRSILAVLVLLVMRKRRGRSRAG